MSGIQHQFGRFCWFELTTHDLVRAKVFYHQLFGWESVDLPNSPDSSYSMQLLSSKTVAGITEATPSQRQHGLPTHWMSHIYTDDIEESQKLVHKLGGKVLQPAKQVVENGWKAIIQDPQGGIVALWEPKAMGGVQIEEVAGSVDWCELASNNPQGAEHFYGALFGWEAKRNEAVNNPYTVFHKGGQNVAGMVQIDEERGNTPPHWGMYFTVENCERSVQLALNLGAQLVVQPTDLIGVGRFSALSDPQGAMFYLMEWMKIDE